MTAESPDPFFSYIVGSAREASRIEYRARAANRYPIHLRGWRCETLSEAFDELAAAFQFPYYFGRNLDALSECLRDFFDEDLQYQSERTGLDVVIWDAQRFMRDGRGVEGRIDLEVLVSILTSMRDDIREPQGVLVGYHRPSRDVRVHLQFDDEDSAADVARWEAAGCGRIPRVHPDT